MTTTPTSTDGQPLGARGLQTRQRILEAVATAIEQNGLRGLRLADIAADVGFSAPAFYQYFNDLDEAILALCEEAGHFIPAFPDPDADWTNDDAPSESTQDFVTRFFDYWNEHRAILWSRNVAVTTGDTRFKDVRDEAFRPMIESIRARIEAGQREGRVDPSVSARGLGAALTVMLDRIGMLSPQLMETWRTEKEADIIDAVAYIFDRVLGFETPARPKTRQPVSTRRATSARSASNRRR